MRLRLILLLLVIVSNLACSQNYVDIAKLYYNGSANNQFENSMTDTKINEFGFELTYPIVLKNNTALFTGLAMERVNLKLFDNEDFTTISAYGLRLGFNKKYSERLSGTYILVPKLASDFRESSFKNFQIGFYGLLKFTRTENLNYKLGLYYNTELFGPFVAPIFGMYYLSPSKKFEVNLLLPSTADFNYAIQKWLNAGINFSGQIKSFRLAELSSTERPGYGVKSSNEVCGYLKFNFTKNISLLSRVGYSVGRTYRVFDENDKIDLGISLIKIGNDRTQLNTNFSDGMVYQAILLYRFIQG